MYGDICATLYISIGIRIKKLQSNSFMDVGYTVCGTLIRRVAHRLEPIRTAFVTAPLCFINKIKFTPEQATKAQRGSRYIPLLFLQPRH